LAIGLRMCCRLATLFGTSYTIIIINHN